MSGFIEGENRQQSTLFPERVDDYIGEDSPVRVVDYFIDKLDISVGTQRRASVYRGVARRDVDARTLNR
jgi:hypothetical protein